MRRTYVLGMIVVAGVVAAAAANLGAQQQPAAGGQGRGGGGGPALGKIEKVERTANGLGNAYGVFDTGPYGAEAQRLVEAGMLRWGSADLDKFEVDEANSDEETGKLVIKKGRLMGWTLVPKPAFQECTIELLDNSLEENEMPAEMHTRVPNVRHI